MSGSDDFYFDSVSQVKMKSWTKGRVALLGDAGYCASPLSGQGNNLALPPVPPIPQVSTPMAGGPATLPPYRVQVGDLLDVKLFLNPELNEEVVVRPDGLISTTLAQDIQAYNHTPAEISAELRDRYRTTLTTRRSP